MAKFEMDTDFVRKLAEILQETNLGEIELADGERRIRVARPTVTMAAGPHMPMQAMAAPTAPAGAAAAAGTPGPGDPDTPLAVGQLDLAEIGLVKDLRQLADELGIHLELCHGRTLRGDCQRASRRAIACNARR